MRIGCALVTASPVAMQAVFSPMANFTSSKATVRAAWDVGAAFRFPALNCVSMADFCGRGERLPANSGPGQELLERVKAAKEEATKGSKGFGLCAPGAARGCLPARRLPAAFPFISPLSS
jgi:hypothetical protein